MTPYQFGLICRLLTLILKTVLQNSLSFADQRRGRELIDEATQMTSTYGAPLEPNTWDPPNTQTGGGTTGGA